MIACQEARRGHRKRGGIVQHLHPGLWVLLRYDRSHGPGEHRVSAGKRRVYGPMLPKVPVPVSFSWTLTPSDVLHWRIDQKRVDEGFQFQESSFSRMGMVALEPVDPNTCQSGGKASDGDIRRVLIELVMSPRQVIFNVTVRYQKQRRRRRNECVPPQIRWLERGDVEFFLVFQS